MFQQTFKNIDDVLWKEAGERNFVGACGSVWFISMLCDIRLDLVEVN